MFGGFGAAGGWDCTEDGHYLTGRRTQLETGAVGVVKGWRVPLVGSHTLQFLVELNPQQYLVLDEEAVKRGLLQDPSPLVASPGKGSGKTTAQPGGSTAGGLSSTNGSRDTATTPDQGKKAGQKPPAKRPRPEPGPPVTEGLAEKLRVLLRRLAAPPMAKSFCKPVPELFPELAERYSALIKRPMDLSLVWAKLGQGLYPTLDRFERDVDRTFLNCERFQAGQPGGGSLHLVSYAKHLREFFKGLLSEMVASHTDDSKRKRREDRLRDWKDEVLSEAELQLIREELAGMEPPVDLNGGCGSAVLEAGGGSVWSVFQAIVALEDWGLRAAVEDAFHLATVFVQERASRGAAFSSIWAKPVALAWASQKKPPFWPCMVLMEGATPEALTRVNRQRMPPEFLKGLLRGRSSRPASAVVVETFGVHDFMWAAPDVVRPYTGPVSDPNEKQVRHPQFQQGLREIEAAYLAQQGKRPEEEKEGQEEEEEGQQGGNGAAAALEEEADDPLRLEGSDLSRVEAEVQASRDDILARDEADEDDDEELLQQALAHKGEEDRKTTSSGRPRVPKKPKGADMSPEATPTNAAAKRKRPAGVKVKKQRALDKIREFIATHLLTEKVLKELDVEHRPKVKRRLLSTPQPFTFGIGPRDVLDAPMLFGGRPPVNYDPYETESDLEEGGEEDDEAASLDWRVVSQRKTLLRLREQSLQREILALQELRRKQRVFAERALGHAFVESQLGPMPLSAGQEPGGGAASGGQAPPKKQAGVRRPRPQASADGHDGGQKEGASSSYERSMYTGVCRSGNRWVARITYGGRKHNLGSFENEKEAALAYDNAAQQQFGAKAKLNFDSNGIFTGHKLRRPAAAPPRGQATWAPPPEATIVDQQPAGYAPRPAYNSDDTEDEEEDDYRPSLMAPREALSETESEEEEEDEDDDDGAATRQYGRSSLFMPPPGRYMYG